ncbi:hypothetical protein ACA910_000739 [Epithemia clementina (nom. ined.)]
MSSLRRLHRPPREETHSAQPAVAISPSARNADAALRSLEYTDYQQQQNVVDRRFSSPSSSPRRITNSARTNRAYAEANYVSNPYSLTRNNSGPPNSSSSSGSMTDSPQSQQRSDNMHRMVWNHPNAGNRSVYTEMDARSQWNRSPYNHNNNTRTGGNSPRFRQDAYMEQPLASPVSAEPSGNYFSEGGRSSKVNSRNLPSVRSASSETSEDTARRQQYYIPHQQKQLPRLNDVYDTNDAVALGIAVRGNSKTTAILPSSSSGTSAEDASVETAFASNITSREALLPSIPNSPVSSSSPRGHGTFLERKRKQNHPTSRLPAGHIGEEAYVQNSPKSNPLHQHEISENRFALSPSTPRRSNVADPPTKVPQRLGFRPRNPQRQQQQLQTQNPAAQNISEDKYNSKGQDPDASHSVPSPRRFSPSDSITIDPPTAASFFLDEIKRENGTNYSQTAALQSKLYLRRPDAPADSTETSGSSQSDFASKYLNVDTVPSVDPNSGVVILEDFSTVPSAYSTNVDNNFALRRDPSMVDDPITATSYSFEESQAPSQDPSRDDLTYQESCSFEETTMPQDPSGDEDGESAAVEKRGAPLNGPQDQREFPTKALLQQSASLAAEISQKSEPPSGILPHRESDFVHLENPANQLTPRSGSTLNRETIVNPPLSSDRQAPLVPSLRTRTDERAGSPPKQPGSSGRQQLSFDSRVHESKESPLDGVLVELAPDPENGLNGSKGFQHTRIGREFFQAVLLPQVQGSSQFAKANEILASQQMEGDKVPSVNVPMNHGPGQDEKAWIDSSYVSSAEVASAHVSSAEAGDERSQLQETESEDRYLLPGASSETVDLNEFIFPDNSLVEDPSSEDHLSHVSGDSANRQSHAGSGAAGDVGIRGLFCCGNLEDDKSSSLLRSKSAQIKGAQRNVLETIQEVESGHSGDQAPRNIQESSSSKKKYTSISVGSSNSALSSHDPDQDPFPLVFAGNSSGDEKKDETLGQTSHEPSGTESMASAPIDTSTTELTDQRLAPAAPMQASPVARLETSVFSDASSWVDEEEENPLESSDRLNFFRSCSTDVVQAPSQDVLSTASTTIQDNLRSKKCPLDLSGAPFGAKVSKQQPNTSDAKNTEDCGMTQNTTISGNTAADRKLTGAPSEICGTAKNETANLIFRDEPQSQLGGRSDKFAKDDCSVGSDKGGSVGSSTAFFDAEEEGSLASFVSLEAMLSMSPRNSLLFSDDDGRFQESVFSCGPGIFSRTDSGNDTGSAQEQNDASSFIQSIQRGISEHCSAANHEVLNSSLFKSIRRGINDPCSPTRSRDVDDDVGPSFVFSCSHSSTGKQKQCVGQVGVSCQADPDHRRVEADGVDRITALRRRELLRRKRLKQLYSSLGERKQIEENVSGRDLARTASVSDDQGRAAQMSSIDANIRAIMLQSRAIVLQKCVRRMLALKTFNKARGAAIKLQSFARVMLAKRVFSEKKNIYHKTSNAICIQACFRGSRAARNFQLARASAIAIQTYLRMVQAKQRLQKARKVRTATILIQANYRRALAVNEFQLNRSCAILIQSHIRKKLVSNRFQLQRLAAVCIQKYIRMLQAVENLFVCKISAIFIQRNYRRSVAVNRFEVAKYAVQSVQALYRRSVAIKDFRGAKERIVLLQTAWKGFYRRRNYKIFLRAITAIQSRARARTARRVYRSILKAVVAIQSHLRTWSSAQIYFKIRLAVLKIQSRWRGILGKSILARVLAHVRLVQGLARIWLARRKAWIRWCAVVTIQSFERRRQARKALRAAKIVWQIETAFSNSTNPATIPANMMHVGEHSASQSEVRPLLDSPISLAAETTSKAHVGVDLDSNSADMDLAASTMEVEEQFPSGCSQMFACVTGEDQAPKRAGSGETHSLLSVTATRAKRNFLNCNPLRAFSQGSGGSMSMDESLVPTRVYSDHSLTATHDDLSTKDYSMSTKDHSTAFASEYTGSTGRPSLTSSLRDNVRQMLGCAQSEDAGESGSGSAEELSTVGEGGQSGSQTTDTKKSTQTGRDLGGIRIFFADTVEYSDTVTLESSKVVVRDKAQDSVPATPRYTRNPRGSRVSGADDETRQTSDEGTMDDTAFRENDSLDSSFNAEVESEYLRRARGNTWFDVKRNPFTTDERNGVSIGDFLESTIDHMCISPGGMAQFFPQSPANLAHFFPVSPKDPTTERSKSSSYSSRQKTTSRRSQRSYQERTPPRPGQRSIHERTTPRHSQRSRHDHVPGSSSPRRQRRTHDNTRSSDRAFIERAVEKSRLPPSTAHRERSKRGHPKSSRSAFQEMSAPAASLSSSKSRRTSSPFDASTHNEQELSFEERTIHTATPSPQPWESSYPSPAFHRTPGNSQNQNQNDSDLCMNDELFHLLANMLLDLIRTKLIGEQSIIVLQSDDKTQIELLLPGQKRDHFVEAVRHRLANLHAQPNALQSLMIRCKEFGFDRSGGSNPILASKNLSNEPVQVDLSKGATAETITSGEAGNDATQLGKLEDDRTQTMVAVERSETVHESQIDGSEIALEQLTAELREATALMKESENPETSRFWQNHVLNLQGRLHAAQSERTPLPEMKPKVFPGFQNREQYVPPNFEEDQQQQSIPSTAQNQKQQPISRDTIESQFPMVDVVSPADLPGGYHFEAEIEGQRFLATVPPGGVQQGETFTCVMRELNSVANDIPVGYWKDGMTSFCAHGCCHVSIWNAIFCPLIALAQIGQRIQLDFLGRVQHPEGYAYKWENSLDVSFADYSALALINLAMIGFTIFVTQSTRYSLREKFRIREERCYDLEDVVCSLFCLPFVVCQMQRHTANYEEYNAVCCSKTGLPDGVGVHADQIEKSSSAFLV